MDISLFMENFHLNLSTKNQVDILVQQWKLLFLHFRKYSLHYKVDNQLNQDFNLGQCLCCLSINRKDT